jgi:ABC-2 type transport system ATP-binding protein
VERAERDAVARRLARFGSVVPAPPGAAAVRLEAGGDLAAVVRALDRHGVRVADLQLHQPSLDDVFLAKTGRKLEARSEETHDDAVGRPQSSRREPRAQVGEMGRRSVLQTLRQPAMVIPRSPSR